MGDSRKRKRKFSEQELELLVHEVSANIYILQGRNTLPSQKHAIWQTITCHINGLSSTRREVEEVKKRWQDIKRRTKEKVAFNRAQTRMTGSGPPQSEPLTVLESVVQQTLISEQVEGVEGDIDTAEPSVQASTSSEPGPTAPGSASQRPTRSANVEELDFMLLTEQRGQTRALQALSKDVQQMSRTLRRDSGQLVCAVNGMVWAITQLSRQQQETNKCLKAIAASIAGGAKEDAPAPAPPPPFPLSPALRTPSDSSDGPSTSQPTRALRSRPIKIEQAHTIPK